MNFPPIPYRPHRLLFGAVLLACSLGSTACIGQAADNLQQQYDTAQRQQTSGDLTAAAQSYQSFLAGTLRRLAEARAASGDYPAAARLFEEMLAVAPADSSSNLRVAYADAALLARDIPEAKSLARAVLAEDPKNAEARLVLGEALLQTDENEEARKQLEAAVALDPSYKNGVALAAAYLALSNTKDAARVFTEMLNGFGDKASYHLDFGRAYAEAGYPDLAIAEFTLALAKDPALPTAHYCLGASILLSQGEPGFPKATEEFQRELALRPDDFFSLSQIGFIELTQHRLAEAQAHLKRAAALDPHNPDNALLLGQIYTQTNQPAQAEAAFRQAIALTIDPSRNHFQVQRAHFLLGRLLIQTGHADEGKREMQLSADLLKQNLTRDQSRLKGAAMSESLAAPPLPPRSASSTVDAKAQQAADAFIARVSPALADGYNNLGVIAAGGNEFATATRYFQKAAQWNPTLEGLDFNWGRAAFAAEFYAQAVGPLSRYLAAHPQEQGARSVLAISFYRLKDYAAVTRTLKPLEPQLASSQQTAANPQLAFLYAQSLVLTGDTEHGISSLERLLRSNPSVAEIHRALGEAYSSRGDYPKATGELRLAIQLNPADSEAKDQLAVALLHQQQKGAQP